jgi:2-polyprenyl-6-hydroxyphenyl methylase/3-demethylubiquinone-9 3-methyltransferase
MADVLAEAEIYVAVCAIQQSIPKGALMSAITTYDVRQLPDPAKYDRLIELESPEVWWELTGPLGGLHLLNQVRVPYFENVLGGFPGKRILDIGCGGGVFTEALATAGARVVAFDASPGSLEAAKEHARKAGLQIDYRYATAEQFDPSDQQFDAVMAVDVLEHVEDVNATIATAARALRRGGVFGFLTHNQTLTAFEELIWQGEYQVGFIPKGNHDFHKFLTPEDLERRLTANGLRLSETRGIAFDLEQPSVFLVDSTEVSYLGYAIKE